MSDHNGPRALPPEGSPVRLIGGPYDGYVAEFAIGRCLAMHDPSGRLPDALYAYDLDMWTEFGRIRIETARWCPNEPCPPRAAVSREEQARSAGHAA